MQLPESDVSSSQSRELRASRSPQGLGNSGLFVCPSLHSGHKVVLGQQKSQIKDLAGKRLIATTLRLRWHM